MRNLCTIEKNYPLSQSNHKNIYLFVIRLVSDTENSFCLLMTALINCVAIVRIRQLRYFYSFCPSFSSSFVLVITVFILTTDTPRCILARAEV